MKKFNPDDSGVWEPYREPNHALAIGIGIAWIIFFVIVLWVLLEWNYRH